MKDSEIRSALLDIEDHIRGAAFEQWRREFVALHLHHFTFDDENKLKYTEVRYLAFFASSVARFFVTLPFALQVDSPGVRKWCGGADFECAP